MCDDFGAFFDTVERVLRAGSGVIEAMDRGLAYKMNGVLGAIFCFDDHGLGRGVDLGDGAVDGANHVVGGAERKDQQTGKDQIPKYTAGHGILLESVWKSRKTNMEIIAGESGNTEERVHGRNTMRRLTLSLARS